MNYGSLATTIHDELVEAIRLILNPEVVPATRQRMLEILLREAGNNVYNVIYAMNAFDMEIMYTSGLGISDAYYGLAKYLSDSLSVGGSRKAYDAFDLWLQDVIHKAQKDAFDTAGENGKYRIVTREEPGGFSKISHRYEGPCEWCQGHVGTFIEPEPEVFAQHDHCNGRIKTSGWKSRNGTLTGKGWKQQA